DVRDRAAVDVDPADLAREADARVAVARLRTATRDAIGTAVARLCQVELAVRPERQVTRVVEPRRDRFDGGRGCGRRGFRCRRLRGRLGGVAVMPLVMPVTRGRSA